MVPIFLSHKRMVRSSDAVTRRRPSAVAATLANGAAMAIHLEQRFDCRRAAIVVSNYRQETARAVVRAGNDASCVARKRHCIEGAAMACYLGQPASRLIPNIHGAIRAGGDNDSTPPCRNRHTVDRAGVPLESAKLALFRHVP